MSKTGLLAIPDEILEDIFNQLDGKTFLNLRRINRRIKNLIDYILQRYDVKQWQNYAWKRFRPISSLITSTPAIRPSWTQEFFSTAKMTSTCLGSNGSRFFKIIWS